MTARKISITNTSTYSDDGNPHIYIKYLDVPDDALGEDIFLVEDVEIDGETKLVCLDTDADKLRRFMELTESKAG